MSLPGYKHMNEDERSKAIIGCYATEATWSGTVLLLDDVVTTGSTLVECSKVLSRAGATEVIALALGKTQFSFDSTSARYAALKEG